MQAEDNPYIRETLYLLEQREAQLKQALEAVQRAKAAHGLARKEGKLSELIDGGVAIAEYMKLQEDRPLSRDEIAQGVLDEGFHPEQTQPKGKPKIKVIMTEDQERSHVKKAITSGLFYGKFLELPDGKIIRSTIAIIHLLSNAATGKTSKQIVVELISQGYKAGHTTTPEEAFPRAVKWNVSEGHISERSGKYIAAKAA
jgi:hypothetical protein